jgi:hypothetical protein
MFGDRDQSTEGGASTVTSRVPASVEGQDARALYDAIVTERLQLKQLADRVRALGRSGIAAQAKAEVIGETIANCVLAFRHLEDASMRLGKALQALDGGVSVYDRAQVPSA